MNGIEDKLSIVYNMAARVTARPVSDFNNNLISQNRNSIIGDGCHGLALEKVWFKDQDKNGQTIYIDSTEAPVSRVMISWQCLFTFLFSITFLR